MTRKHTPGPWQYVPGNEHHGPYVTSEFGSTICDFYTMTRPDLLSTLNGGPSRPVPFLHEMAEHNARLAAAAPQLLKALEYILDQFAEGNDPRVDDDGDEVDPLENARAAIAEATGD